MPWPTYGAEPPEMVNAVLFDPMTRKFSYTSAMNVPSEEYISVLLRDGRVFFNGAGRLAVKSPERAPELYDPGSGKFRTLTPTPGLRMWGRMPVLLNSGKLLVVSGEYPEDDPGDPPLLWDPDTNRIKTLRGTIKPRIALTLDNGKILFIGSRPRTLRPGHGTILRRWQFSGKLCTVFPHQASRRKSPYPRLRRVNERTL